MNQPRGQGPANFAPRPPQSAPQHAPQNFDQRSGQRPPDRGQQPYPPQGQRPAQPPMPPRDQQQNQRPPQNNYAPAPQQGQRPPQGGQQQYQNQRPPQQQPQGGQFGGQRGGPPPQQSRPPAPPVPYGNAPANPGQRPPQSQQPPRDRQPAGGPQNFAPAPQRNPQPQGQRPAQPPMPPRDQQQYQNQRPPQQQAPQHAQNQRPPQVPSAPAPAPRSPQHAPSQHVAPQNFPSQPIAQSAPQNVAPAAPARPPQPGQQPPRQSQPQNFYAPAPRQAPVSQPPHQQQRPQFNTPAPATTQRPAAPAPVSREPAPAPREPAPIRREPEHRPAAPIERSENRSVPAPAPAPAAAQAHTPGSGPAPGTAAFNQKAHDDIFDKKTRFADLGLAENVLAGVTDAGFEFPTGIQARIIPLLLQGKDMLGQAKTGTGKTAAFGLPLLTKIQRGDALSAIVLVPTRELAIQVATDLAKLGKHTGLTVLPVYGGQNISTQAERLKRGPEIIVATPGRLMDMRERGYVRYDNIKVAILDEVDRMLDIGFRDDIRRILGACPPERQTIFVSATLPPAVEALARSFARNAEKIVATTGSLTASLVKQYHLPVEPWDKKQLLLHLLTHESPALTIVFCRTKKTVDNLAEYLFRKGIDAHAIHGDMYQAKRNKVIEQLKSGQLGVLIASDLASRGLDVEGITHVINYDLPDDPDLYIHRIGRTARAGRDGIAWSLVTPEQGGLLTEIEMLINAEIPKLDYPDFKPGQLPPDVAAERARDASRRTDGPKMINRYAVQPTIPTQTAAAASAGEAPAMDPSKFPGGIIPSKLPARRLGGKVRSARSMRNAPPAPAPANTAAAPAPAAPAEASEN